MTSPNEKLLQTILGQQDFIKKQKNIISFVDNFCRKYNSSNDLESPNWFYCNITNEQLMPTFFYELADAYFQGKYKELELLGT